MQDGDRWRLAELKRQTARERAPRIYVCSHCRRVHNEREEVTT
jgi:hypothetical protein